MITEWWKDRKAKKAAMEADAIAVWKNQYFQEIQFPIIIFNIDDYLGVSDIKEYYYDVDINIWYVNENCELVDSKGDKFNFKKINDKQWVPDKKIGQENFQAVKARLCPLLYESNHKKGLDKTSNLIELIELMLHE